MTTFKPSDIADIWENPNFGELSFDERGAVLESIISGASDYARSAPDYDADVQRTMNQLIDASRAKLGSSETYGEKAKWAAGVAGQTVVDSAKVVAATAADMGVVQDNNQTGSIEGKLPLENVGKGLWTGAQGIWEAAGHGIAAIKNRDQSKALETEIDRLKAEIDDVRYPIKRAADLKAWLMDRDDALIERRRAWIKAADTQADDAAIDAQVQKRQLTKDPEILNNLVAYMRNRTPGAWDEVRRSLIETPTTAKLNAEREAVKGTAVGRFLDNTGVGADMLVAAGDPLDNALIGLIPVGKGAAAVRKGFKAGLKTAAAGVAIETASEVGSLLTENPDATLGQIAETAKAGAIGAGGLTAAGAAGSKAMQMWRGQGAPGVDDQGEDNQAAVPQQSLESIAPAVPQKPFDTVFADQPYQFRDGVWYGPYIPDSLDEVDSSPTLLPAMVPLNPAKAIEGSLIVRLDSQRKAAIRKKAEPSPAASFAPPVQAPVASNPIPANEQNTTPPMDGQQGGGQDLSQSRELSALPEQAPSQTPEARAISRRSDNLPDPTGTDSDLISALKRTGTLGVTDGPEWNWYRQLETDAKTSPLKKQEAEARARRGELDGDAKVTLAWLNQNGLVSTEGGKRIDEAVEELTGAKIAEGEQAFQRFDVEAANLGESILAAIDARVTARAQGDIDGQMAEEERLVVAAERELSNRFIAHAVSSPGTAMSGNALSNAAVVGSKVEIGGKSFEVVDVNPTAGTVDVEGEFGWQRILPDDEVNVTAVDGQEVDEIDMSGVENAPFSLAESLSQAEMTQADNAAKAAAVGLPTEAGVTINAAPVIREALNKIAGDTKLNRMWRAIARALSQQSYDGVDLRVESDVRRAYAGYYLNDRGIREIGVNLRQVGRGQVDSVGTFLHEALHHATLAKIQDPQGEIETEAVQALASVVKRVKAYASAQDVGGKFWYELSNVEEFVSALFTRQDFQEFLAGIPDDFAPKTAAGKFRSVLSEIMRVLAQLVTGKRIAKGSTLEQAMTATLALFDTAQRNAEGVRSESPAATYLPQAPNAMRLVSARMSEASDSLREMLKDHKATRDERTVDGDPIEKAGYLVRRDADMEAVADEWLDDFAEQQSREGLSMEQTRAALSELLDREDVDISAVLLTRLIDERGRDFGFDPAEVQALGQKNASRAGFALREWRKTLDPLDKLVDEANTKTGTEMGKALGVDVGKGGNPADVPAQLNQELQQEMKVEADKALLDAVGSLRGKNSELRRELDEAKARIEEEKARADQEREVGIAIGREEKATSELESWINGESQDGRPSLEEVAQRFVMPQGWNGERFRAAVSQLFPNANPNVVDLLADAVSNELAGTPSPAPTSKVRRRNGGVQSNEGNLDQAEKSLRQLYEEDGAARIADSFFRDGEKRKARAPLAEGSSLLNAELTRVLNESLDALGIARKKETKDPNDIFREVAVGLGLQNLREGKMTEIDKRVREKIAEAGSGLGSEWSQDMIAQWEKVSAGMLGAPISGTLARRIANLLLSEREWSISEMASKLDAEVKWMAAAIGKMAAERVSAISPDAGGMSSDDVANVEKVVTGTVIAMVEKRREDQVKAAELRKSPEEVTRRAEAIADRLAQQMSDTPSAFQTPAQKDALRKLVSDAMGANEEMSEKASPESKATNAKKLDALNNLRERAMALGVSSEVAGQLVNSIAEARRGKIAVANFKKMSRLEESRKKAVTKFLDRLADRASKRGKSTATDQKLATFYKHLQNATKLGILDSQVFADAFASAWGLNGLNPALIAQLRQTYQNITATNAQGLPVHFGMVRETMERRFIEAVNRLAPAQSWGNFIFNNYQARVLSSATSILNQFSGVFRMLLPVDAVARSYRMGTVRTVFPEWWKSVSSLGRNLPLMITAIKGESLGHLPSQVASGYVPTSQQTQNITGKDRIRVGGKTFGVRTSQILRLVELWSWRTIRAAEGLTGIADAEAHFREVLTRHYIDGGMKPAAAYKQALEDIHADPAAIVAARQQAEKEQAVGDIGTGAAVLKRRTAEIIQRDIDTSLAAANTARSEQLTAYAQFKTMPAGPVGFAVSKAMAKVSGSQGPLSKYARFWFMFGRFLGHAVDQTLAYNPATFWATRRIMDSSNTQRLKLIKEVFGSEEAYNRYVDSRAAAGTAFLLAVGVPALISAMAAGDDEDPFFSVTGTALMSLESQKDALRATGRWSEQQVRINGFKFGYSQIPELAPLLGVIGNISDHIRFGKLLNQREPEDREMPGKKLAKTDTVALGIGFDFMMSPIKRSTYKAWFDMAQGALSFGSTGEVENLKEKLIAKATQPIDGLLRVPVVVDVDKYLRFQQGNLKPDGIADSIMRRIPFVHVGGEVFNAYGEKTPAWDMFSYFPTDPKFEDQTKKAALLNAQTGTVRTAPKSPELKHEDGSKRVLTQEELAEYQRLSGKLFTESLLKNEADIRRAYSEGGQGSAAKIVRNVSDAANKRAKEELGIK